MEELKELTNPKYVTAFQNFCGVLPKTDLEITDEVASDCQMKQMKNELSRRVNESEKCENNNIRNGFTTKADNLNETGKWHVSNGTNRGPTPSVVQDGYIIKYRTLYYLAKFGAFLGDEPFYMLFYSFFLWNLDGVVVRQTIIIWCMVMYLGQATKDYLRWPRPPSPPVIHLETQYLREFSMPSTHAMAGTAVPLVLCVLLCSRYQVPCLFIVAVGIFWCTLVCLSRLYLGVHTVLDVLCGFIFAIVIVAVFLPYMEDFDIYQQTHLFAPIVVFVTGLALCTVCYPSKDVNSAKGDAVQIISVTVGISTGVWFNYQLGLVAAPEASLPYPVMVPTVSWGVMSFLRILIGALLTAIVRLLLKSLSVRIFSYFYGLEKPDKNHPSVQTGSKFVTYFCIGHVALCGIPLIYKMLGIARPGAFNELY